VLPSAHSICRIAGRWTEGFAVGVSNTSSATRPPKKVGGRPWGTVFP